MKNVPTGADGARRLNHLDPVARDMAERSLDWMDRCWDPAIGLLRMPDGIFYLFGRLDVDVHMVRETAWYVVGLLLRDAPGDAARARRAIATLLDYQFDAPCCPYHGTWYRSPHEPAPPAEPVEWRDYDPNWREFIGTTLALVLLEYEARLPAALVERIEAALRRAIVGTLARDVPARYTNIALMKVFLLQFGATRLDEPAWLAGAERLADEILRRFRPNQTFDEFNSPTYYGIDLYALALWRSYAAVSSLRTAGAAMEAALWRDIARFYHARMRNLCGPYDRSYGMDMRRYVADLGMWIWLSTGYARAPFPDLEQPLELAWGLAAAPMIALLGARVPPEALPHLLAFQGERQVERVIASDPRQVATAWLGPTLMLGADDSSSSPPVSEQYHPVTVHWLIAADCVGWIRLRTTARVHARAERGRLAIACTRHDDGDPTFVFQISAPGLDPAALGPDRWVLPGLTVHVETNAADLRTTRDGDLVELRYEARGFSAETPVRFTLWIEQDSATIPALAGGLSTLVAPSEAPADEPIRNPIPEKPIPSGLGLVVGGWGEVDLLDPEDLAGAGACAEPARSAAPARKDVVIASARVRHGSGGPEVELQAELAPGAGFDPDAVTRIVVYRVAVEGVNPMADHLRGVFDPPLGWDPADMTEIASVAGPAAARQTLTDRGVESGHAYAYRVAYSTGRGISLSPIMGVRVHAPDAWWPTECVEAEIAKLTADFSGRARSETIGRGAHKGLAITALRLGDPAAPTLVLVGCIHAGESGPELILPALRKLLERAKEGSALAQALTRVGVFAVPVLNPDERDRLLSGHPTYLRTSPQGIDLNRNFPAGWDEVSPSYGTTSAEPGSWTYRGAFPLSAVEARALHDALAGVRVAAVLSYHWLYSLTGPELGRPTAPADPVLKGRQSALAAAWFAGLGKLPYPAPVKPSVLDASPGGSLITWAQESLHVPAFEVEGAGDPRLERLKDEPPALALLTEYQERHADALESVLLWLAREG